MPKAFSPRKRNWFSLPRFSRPLKRIISGTPPLVSRGNKPLEFTFEQELTALMLFHLEEHRSGQELPESVRNSARFMSQRVVQVTQWILQGKQE